MPKKRKQRVQFDMSDRTVETLDRLREDSGATSRAEVIRRSLTLMEVVTELQARDGAVILRANDGREERLVLL